MWFVPSTETWHWAGVVCTKKPTWNCQSSRWHHSSADSTSKKVAQNHEQGERGGGGGFCGNGGGGGDGGSWKAKSEHPLHFWQARAGSGP